MKKLLFLLLFSFNAFAVERVIDFHSAIRIGADGALDVTERITVQAEGGDIRRGILRDFPTGYRDRFNNVVRVPFEVRRVTRNGEPETFAVEPLSNGARIRIGRAEVLLPRGQHTYEIHYRTSRQVGFFKEHDELYWNVNGNGWVFAFDNISAEVSLPAKVPARDIRVEAYTGAFGARGGDYRAFTADGSAAFRATRPLPAGHGLTIVVGFPKGIVAPPTLARRIADFLGDNQAALFGLATWLLVAGALGWHWRRVGRDPRAGPKFPRYDPPPGIGPAGARYVDKMYWDGRCVSAMLLGLGARGFLKLRAEEGVFVIERTGRPVEWLVGEESLSSFLLGPGHPTVIDGGHNLGLQTAAGLAARRVEVYFGERIFSTNRVPVALAGAASAFAVFSMLAAQASWTVVVPVALLLAGTIAVFWRIAPAYTVEGRKLQDAIEGLRQYLSVAEKDELARMKAPPQTQAEFARLLPYAVALEVEKTWADRFTKLLGAAEVAEATAAYYDAPAFRRGGDVSRSLGDSLSRMTEVVSSSTTPPSQSSGFSSSSSGGGGGGSSGGGGGGGGGRGW